MKKWLLPLLLLTTALAVSRWVIQTYRSPGSMTVLESQTMKMNPQPPPGASPVSLEEVQADFFQPDLTLTGTAEPWAREEVVARVTGRILKIHVYPGDPVQPGQLLVELDSQELQQRTLAAQAAVVEAQHRLGSAHQHHQRGRMELEVLRQEIRATQLAIEQANAERDSARSQTAYLEAEWKRADKLYREGGVSQEEWQKSQTDLVERRSQQKVKELEVERARANYAKAQKQLQMQATEAQVFQGEAAALRAGQQKSQAEADLSSTIASYTRLTALQRGTVAERLVSPGTLVQPGTAVLRLISTDRLRLQARVPQDYADQIELGARVTVEVPGHDPLVTRISSDFLETQAATRTFTVEAQIPNQSGKLRAGSYVSMRIALAKRKRRLTVAVPALQHDLEGNPFLWVAVDGKAVKRKVKTGGTQAGRISISEGIMPGEKVVVAGFQGLREGSRVTDVPWSDHGPVELPARPTDIRPDEMPDDYCLPTPGMKQ